MGTVDSVAITLDKAVYYAGEPITGFLTVTVSSPIEGLDSVDLHFEGNAHAEWTETRERTVTDSNGESRTETYTETYSSDQVLIDLHRAVFIKGGDFLPAGQHTFPFSLETPYHLVSSFEGTYGHVRYSLEAKNPQAGFLESFYSRRNRVSIKLLQPIDTNVPMYSFPVSGEDTKTVCCCCCASGPLTIETQTDRAAYCPGELVALTANFENNSKREVQPYVNLIQHQKYYAQGSSNFYTKSWRLKPLGDEETEHWIAEGGSCQWHNLQFRVPLCCPSLKCEIMDIYYCVEVAMDIPMAFNLRVSLPVVLATIPYRGPQVITRQIVGATAPPLPIGWSGIGLQTSPRIEPSAPPIAVADEQSLRHADPPPSYFETVFADQQHVRNSEGASGGDHPRDKKTQ